MALPRTSTLARLPPATTPGIHRLEDIPFEEEPPRLRARFVRLVGRSPDQVWAGLCDAHGPRIRAIVATIRVIPALTALTWLRPTTSAALGEHDGREFPLVLGASASGVQVVFVGAANVDSAQARVGRDVHVLPFDVLRFLEDLGAAEPAERALVFGQIAARSDAA